MTINKKDLLEYEAPSISEHISIGWIQTIIGRYIARKINRKWRRYQERLRRERFIKSVESGVNPQVAHRIHEASKLIEDLPN